MNYEQLAVAAVRELEAMCILRHRLEQRIGPAVLPESDDEALEKRVGAKIFSLDARSPNHSAHISQIF